MQLRINELEGIKRFNRFIVFIFIESWFSSRCAADAPINDIKLIQRLNSYDDDNIRSTGLNMMQRHSWYVSPEVGTLILFSE